MKTLNQLIGSYTCLLRQGELQAAYKGILEFIGRLRSDFMKMYPDSDIGGVYPGYMHMSYFSFSTKLLKDKGLKIAIVYLHEKGRFEVWLSARNREIKRRYESGVKHMVSVNPDLFHDETNPDAIIEYTLEPEPDFENQALLIHTIEHGVDQFITSVACLL